MIVIRRIGAQTAACALNPAHVYLRCELGIRRVDAQSIVLRRRIDIADRRVDNRRNPAESYAQRIGPSGTENMVLLQDHRLPPRKIPHQPGIQGVWRVRHRVIEHVGPKEVVPIGEMVVQSRGPKIFPRRTRRLHRFNGRVPCSGNTRREWALHRITRFGRRPERIEVLSDSICGYRILDKPRTVRGLRCGKGRIAKFSRLRRRRRDDHGSGPRQRLTQPLVAAEDKRLVFLDWSAGKCSELIPLKRWNFGPIKEVPSIQRAVA